MKPNQIILGDSFHVLRTLDADSFDAVVTDPPYHLTAGKKGGSGEASVNPDSPAGRSMISTGFMGKQWDGGDIAFRPAFWAEVLRVMKPGAHLVAFGGTRTYHRMVCGIEDAGFEVRDQLAWTFGSGFPKSSNQDGAWTGWGTALKPAWEPIVLARKPLIGTVPVNLAAHRTGALNIDGCRIPFSGTADEQESKEKNQHAEFETGPMKNHIFGKFDKPKKDYDATGRWPANLLHDGSPEVVACFPESNGAGHAPARSNGAGQLFKANNGTGGLGSRFDMVERDFGSGNVSRFFYCAKAGGEDRDAGLADFASTNVNDGRKTSIDNAYQRGDTLRKNTHPTVKPTDLMRWLCRLVTPPGGRILDPFLGSGSTGRGAVLEGFTFTGIEREAEYAAIAQARVNDAIGGLLGSAELVDPANAKEGAA